jgi:putative transposase
MDQEDTGTRVTFVLHDRDASFTAAFDAVFQAAGARVIWSAVQVPRMNAYAERWVRTARAEVTDRMLITGQGHLRAVLEEYVEHYNRHRPHRARNLRSPDSHDATTDVISHMRTAEIRRQRVLGGLINEYQRAA